MARRYLVPVDHFNDVYGKTGYPDEEFNLDNFRENSAKSGRKTRYLKQRHDYNEDELITKLDAEREGYDENYE